ncbi:hypothetical protein PENTCL1PPCAC_22886, partial [Pristionchus entomophagus]
SNFSSPFSSLLSSSLKIFLLKLSRVRTETSERLSSENAPQAEWKRSGNEALENENSGPSNLEKDRMAITKSENKWIWYTKIICSFSYN